jgi:glycosyltransferase involved in cell wall biosynthesis
VSIAVILGVKDELDLVRPSIEHLERMGVREIVVIDAMSTDGTQDVLEELRKAGRIRLHFHDNTTVDDRTDRENVQAMIEACQAEWLLILDADEFVLTDVESLLALPEIRSNALDLITLPRRNVVLGSRGPCMPLPPVRLSLEQTLVVAEPIFDFWADPVGALQTPWIFSGVMPRMLARREVVHGVKGGAHDVECGDGARRGVARSAFVAHLPFTTFARFERKVGNIGQLIENHPDDFVDNSMHWVRWHRIHREGRLREDYDRQVLDGAQLQAMQDDGRVASARAFLDRLAMDPAIKR